MMKTYTIHFIDSRPDIDVIAEGVYLSEDERPDIIFENTNEDWYPGAIVIGIAVDDSFLNPDMLPRHRPPAR
jgi:hypothetical protein